MWRSLRDPRHLQIGTLSLLLATGLSHLSLDVSAEQIALTLLLAQFTQWACCRVFNVPYDVRSAAISSLSLCLLLRVDHLWWVVFATVVTIGSKFVLRHRGKHVFNPTNLGIGICLLLSDSVWVSPGQWGSGPLLGFFFACMGITVILRSRRSDVTFAFLAIYAAIVLGRSLYLGDPWVVPLHTLKSGALLLFAFFMISDPRTTPNARIGRVAFAAIVAVIAAVVQFGLYQQDGLVWGLLIASCCSPLINRLFTGEVFEWTSVNKTRPTLHNTSKETWMKPFTLTACTLCALAVSIAAPQQAQAFCGFYVAKADAKLFNEASQVVLVRDGNRTVVTMASDYRGKPKDFAMVIPVPTVLERGQINIGNQATIDHLDTFTAPRLVEYHDPDPCRRMVAYEAKSAMGAPRMAKRKRSAPRKTARDLGVTIEATYTVGEYDILILSAKESHGLTTWLRGNDYRIPDGAEPVVKSYLKQGMKFFVAKVNLEQQGKLGFQNLRPIQVAYESPKFMLPIRLGTVNANGPQELFVYALTRKGRVETTNYRTTKLPTGQELPPYVKGDFPRFYKDMFATQVKKEGMRTVFLEYAWDMSWCDPCAANPLSPKQLKELGVFWAKRQRGPAQNVYATRLHVRYDAEHFPDDLRFRVTGNRRNFQGRYVLRHPFAGSATCEAAGPYFEKVAEREQVEATTLHQLTGWSLADIRRRLPNRKRTRHGGPGKSWWETMWQ